MKKLSMYLAMNFMFSLSVSAFILIDPGYRLSNPEDVRLGVVAGGCSGNGISDAELVGYLEEAVDDYWNTVPDSLLYIKVVGEIARESNGEASPGTIFVTCDTLSDGTLGVANVNSTNNGCRLRMSDKYIGGSLNREDFMGTLIHELGHCVGLNHSDDTASVMTYNATVYVQPAALSRDDKDGVTYLYPYGSEAGLFGSCSLLASSGERPQGTGFLIALLSFIGTLVVTRMLFKRIGF